MRGAAACLLALAALPGVAAAHHSFFGRFDTLTLVELEGEVTDVLWRNPHAYFSVRADGVVWEIETSSLTVLKRLGIEPGTIRVGDRVRVAANPPVGAKKEMYARHVLLPDGRELLLNVGLKPRWTSGDLAVGDESLLMARSGDGSRPDLGIFRVWSHTRTIARLVSRSDGSDRRHQRLSADAGRARAARGVRSQHRQPDGELRAEGHADDHGGAVSDRVRARRTAATSCSSSRNTISRGTYI